MTIDGVASYELPMQEEVLNGIIREKSDGNCLLGYERDNHHFRDIQLPCDDLKAKCIELEYAKKMEDVLLLHEKTRPHTNLQTMEAIIRTALDCVAPSTIQPRSGTVRLLMRGQEKITVHRQKFRHNDNIK